MLRELRRPWRQPRCWASSIPSDWKRDSLLKWAILNLDPEADEHTVLENVAAKIDEDADPNNPDCCYLYTNPAFGKFEAKVTDPGSDDLTLEWDFNGVFDFDPEVIVTYYNNAPVNTPDPYPSPDGTFPFTIIDTQIWGYPTPPRIFNPRLKVRDDDGGMAPDEDPGQPWSADWTFEYEISWIPIELGFVVVDVTVTYLDWDSVVIRYDPLTGPPMSNEVGGLGFGGEGGRGEEPRTMKWPTLRRRVHPRTAKRDGRK